MADPTVLFNETEADFRSLRNLGGASLPHRLARPLEADHILLPITQGGGLLTSSNRRRLRHGQIPNQFQEAN